MSVVLVVANHQSFLWVRKTMRQHHPDAGLAA
jgi:hypothetical protein